MKTSNHALNPTNHTLHSEEMGVMVDECSLSLTHDFHSQSSNLILIEGEGVNWWPKPIWSIPVPPVFPGCHRYYSPQPCKCNRWDNENKRTCRMLKTRPYGPHLLIWRTSSPGTAEATPPIRVRHCCWHYLKCWWSYVYTQGIVNKSSDFSCIPISDPYRRLSWPLRCFCGLDAGGPAGRTTRCTLVQPTIDTLTPRRKIREEGVPLQKIRV